MAENLTPRQIVKQLLRGVLPPRPLVLPIVFSLGARVENLPLRMFLGNPTKISHSLRQIHSHLRSDGVACYFDPGLEAEALGGVRHWEREDQGARISWPPQARKGELPAGLRSPEEAAKSPPVTVAAEVIRRLKSLLREEPLLMAGVAGPFTLAARITQLEHEEALYSEELSDAALEMAAAVIAQISAAFLEAGAHLILIQEQVLPALSAGSCGAWNSLLAPVFNIIRFYEALPVLLITSKRSLVENCGVIFQQHWDCVVCPVLDGIRPHPSGRMPKLRPATLGIALPPGAFQADESGGEDVDQILPQVISELRPTMLTTAGDVPTRTDIKHLRKVFEHVCR